MKFKRTSACLLVGAIISLSFCTSTLASAPVVALPEPEEVSTAKLALMPLMLDTYAPVTEKELVRRGCTFVTEPDSSHNLELMQILQDGMQIKESGEKDFRLRSAVYLNLKDGSTIRLLISDAQNLKPGVFGTIDNGTLSERRYLTSKEAMLRNLRAWAKATLHNQKPGSDC